MAQFEQRNHHKLFNWCFFTSMIFVAECYYLGVVYQFNPKVYIDVYAFLKEAYKICELVAVCTFRRQKMNAVPYPKHIDTQGEKKVEVENMRIIIKQFYFNCKTSDIDYFSVSRSELSLWSGDQVLLIRREDSDDTEALTINP